MVDFDLEIKNIQSINIKNTELNRYKIDEKIKKSIILYNMAIGEMKRNNLDLAINDLKKALYYNKDFSEAIKLMGLCYVNITEYKKAEKIFKKLAKHDIYNELANEYIESLTIKKVMTKAKGNIDEVKYISNNTMKKHVRAKSARGIIIALSIFIIIMAGFAINYLNPLNIKGILKEVQYNNNRVYTEEKINENSDNDDSSSERDIVAYEDNESIKKDSDNTKSELDDTKNKANTSDMLSDADIFFKNGNYEKSASTLINMKNMNLDVEEKLKFDKLWQEVKTSGAWKIYNEGNKLYKEKKYGEALPKLKISSEIDPNLNIMPWATFQIGMCYKEIKDYNNSLIYFNKVVHDYPKSSYVSNAKMMINQIGQ